MNIKTEEKIIRAAKQEFSEMGFHGCRMDSIAKRAGVNKAMIYYHFASKDVLYLKLLDSMFQIVYKIISEHLDLEMSADNKFFVMYEKLIDHIFNIEPELRKILIWEIASGGKFLKKIIIKNKITDLVDKIIAIYKEGFSENSIKKINPIILHLTLVFSTMMISSFKDIIKTSGKIKLFATAKGIPGPEKIQEMFKTNIMEILKNGIKPD